METRAKNKMSSVVATVSAEGTLFSESYEDIEDQVLMRLFVAIVEKAYQKQE